MKSASILIACLLCTAAAAGYACAGEPVEVEYANRVIVRIDGKPLTEYDVTLYMRYADPDYFKLKDIIENAERLQAVQEARQMKALQDLARLRMLIAYAARLDLKIPEGHKLEMQKKFEEQQVEKFGSAQKYREHLASRELSLEEVFGFELDREMATQLRLKEYRRMPTPTQNEIRESYECNRNLFHLPDSYTARHFKIAREKDGTEITGAKKTAEAAHAAISAGKPLENIAENASGSGAHLTSESVQWLKGNSSLLKEVAEAAEKLEPGEVSGIVETADAFHFVLLEKIEKGELQSVDKVWDRIDDALRARNWRRARSIVMAKAFEVVTFNPDGISIRGESVLGWKEFLSGDIILKGPGAESGQ